MDKTAIIDTNEPDRGIKMNLQKQLKRIEQLKTDKQMRLLLEGFKCLDALDVSSEELLGSENKYFNDELYFILSEYSKGTLDKFNFPKEKFNELVSKEICAFCAFYDNDHSARDIVFNYVHKNLTIDELVNELKQYAIDLDNTPNGYIIYRSKKDRKQYVSLEKDPFAFLNDLRYG
jgi:hypothetical protein